MHPEQTLADCCLQLVPIFLSAIPAAAVEADRLIHFLQYAYSSGSISLAVCLLRVSRLGADRPYYVLCFC